MNKQGKTLRVLFFCFPLLSFLFYCESSNNSSSYLGEVPFPTNNPQTRAKIELGKQLFFDKRLSPDNSIACATCHQPQKAFTDGLTISTGFHNRLAMRNAPTLLNVGYQKKLMFDGEVPSLEMQVLVPLKDSEEMANDLSILIKKLQSIPSYQKQAKDIFQRDFDAYVLTRSLASYQRSLVSNQTPYDKFVQGDKKAISPSAIRGLNLFTNKLYCANCHTPPFFTNFNTENNGLYANYLDKIDKGRFRIHGDSNDIGSFKVPTLRNIDLTAPYMHDGSIATLEGVILHYAKGGNNHPRQSNLIVPFQLNIQDKRDLMEFFKALSDPKETK